tara:strand:- start:513 stop:1499 length:987 start_codon:yes stop_codon:yes gene_type:complete
MNEKNILVIGCGGIGSRHLESLCKIDIPVNIYGFDINDDSLTKVKKLIEPKNNLNVKLINLSKELPENISQFDLCIISTSSNVRLKLLKKIVSKYIIKNLILEKVLFQSIPEYEEAKNVIDKNKINCWVNCSRREDKFWGEIKKILSDHSNLSLYYGNSNWDLCCNSIHMIDLAAWLFNDSIEYIDNSLLDKKIYESKRKDFIEFTGILTGKFKNGSVFKLESTYGIPRNESKFEIVGEGIRLIVNEYDEKCILYKERNNNWIQENLNFHRLLQSEKTHDVAKKILQQQKCNLTKLNESIQIHEPLIESFTEHLNKISNSKFDYCPIT